MRKPAFSQLAEQGEHTAVKVKEPAVDGAFGIKLQRLTKLAIVPNVSEHAAARLGPWKNRTRELQASALSTPSS